MCLVNCGQTGSFTGFNIIEKGKLSIQNKALVIGFKAVFYE